MGDTVTVAAAQSSHHFIALMLSSCQTSRHFCPR
jgi:hypothetical protein